MFQFTALCLNSSPILYRTRLTGGMVGEGVEPNLFTVLFIRAVCPFQEYLIQNKVNWWHGRGRGRAKFVYRPLYQSSLSLPRISLVKKTATMMVQVLHNSKNFTGSFTCMHTPPKESNTSFSSE